MKNLSELDVVILKELLRDGRKSFTALAKDCQASKDVIWKHYKEMEKAGIIVGATIQYNYPGFGFEGVGVILVNVESQHTNEVLSRLRKFSTIRPFRQYDSLYNIGIIANLRKLSDLDSIKEELRRQNPVNSIRTYLWTGVRNTPENLSMGLLQKTSFQQDEVEPKKIVLAEGNWNVDELDLQIVDKLTSDGRVAFSNIGLELGVSTDTVARRYSKLVDSGLIKVSIQINPVKLGYKGILNCYLSVSSQAVMKNTIEKICKIPDVSYIVKTVGEYDLQVSILIRGIEEIYRNNEEIIKIHNIKKLETDLRPIPEIWPSPRQHISTF
jgi:Lrp/AsnC family transcriptional regulator, regulator for asnA, asnC and gidA